MGVLFAFLKSQLGRNILAGFAATGLIAWGYHVVYSRGYDACTRDNQVVLAGQIARAAEEARELALQDAEIIQQGEQARERIRTVYREREVEVSQHVPQDCSKCAIAPAGVGLLNDALAGRLPPPGAAEPAPPVPSPAVPGQGGKPSGAWSPGDRYRRFIL